MKHQERFFDLLFFTYHGVVGLLVGIVLIMLANTILVSHSTIKKVLNSLGGAFIIGTIFDLVYTKISRNIYFEDIRYLVDRERSGFRHIFPKSDNPDAIEEIVNRLKSARDVFMYGIALNILWKPEVVELLHERASNRKTRVTIFLADPNSPRVKDRLREESSFPFPNTEGKQAIENVLKRMKDIETTIGNTEYFAVHQFVHYPTMAILIIDDQIFTYTYGYKTIGTVSPMLHLQGLHSRQAKFYISQFEVLVQDYTKKINTHQSEAQ